MIISCKKCGGTLAQGTIQSLGEHPAPGTTKISINPCCVCNDPVAAIREQTEGTAKQCKLNREMQMAQHDKNHATAAKRGEEIDKRKSEDEVAIAELIATGLLEANMCSVVIRKHMESAKANTVALVDAQDRQTDMLREAAAKKLDLEASAVVLIMVASGVKTDMVETWQTKAHKDIAAFRAGAKGDEKAETPLPLVEIVHEHDDSVHYRRPWGHPDIDEAINTPGYYIRPERSQADD